MATIWASEVPQWSKCSGSSSSICPDQWGAHVEVYNCLNVWIGVSQGQDLRDEYHERNWETLEKLVAMAAVRLAATLNELFD